MPKIIDNVREELLKEAKKQLIENGYSYTTIRSVARGCGIAIGTVSNYFPSKDILIATFMMEDWNTAFSSVERVEKTNKKSPWEKFKNLFK